MRATDLNVSALRDAITALLPQLGRTVVRAEQHDRRHLIGGYLDIGRRVR